MTSLANEFRTLILSRAMTLRHVVEGCRVESPDDEHVRIITAKATANVNFYELDLRDAGDYAAVMLAPQVHARRAEMVERHPELVAFEIPGAVFGSYDAGSALRMLLNAMSENALAARMEQASTRIVRKLDNDKRILVGEYALCLNALRQAASTEE